MPVGKCPCIPGSSCVPGTVGYMLEVDPCLQNADILCLHSKCIGSVDVGSCTTMPPTVAVPVCPPHTPCGLERLFFQQGWIWNDDVLTEVLGWLHRQGIEDGYDLVGTSRAEDIPGAERFPCDVLQFISKAAMARVCLIYFHARATSHVCHRRRRPLKMSPWRWYLPRRSLVEHMTLSCYLHVLLYAGIEDRLSTAARIGPHDGA